MTMGVDAIQAEAKALVAALKKDPNDPSLYARERALRQEAQAFAKSLMSDLDAARSEVDVMEERHYAICGLEDALADIVHAFRIQKPRAKRGAK